MLISVNITLHFFASKVIVFNKIVFAILLNTNYQLECGALGEKVSDAKKTPLLILLQKLNPTKKFKFLHISMSI
jgi:hypothetical protein